MNLPLFERLGVLDKVRALGVFKRGADFEADNERGYNTYAFARAIGRARRMPIRCGARTSTGCSTSTRANAARMRAKGTKWCGSSRSAARDSRLEVRSDDGASYAIQARYVVDASGRDALLSSRSKLRRRNDRAPECGDLRPLSRRRPPRRARMPATSASTRFAHGWMWMIPLPDGVMSVGAVCRPDYLKQRKGRTRRVPAPDTLKRNPALWQRLAGCRADRRRGARHRQLFLRREPHGRAGLDPGRRCVRLSRPGVLLGRLPGDERGRAGGATGRSGAARTAREAACCAGWSGASAPRWRASRSSSTASTAR